MNWAIWIIDDGRSGIRDSLQHEHSEKVIGLPGYVDGSSEKAKAMFDNSAFTAIYGRKPSDGEIGCTLAHLKAYRFLAESNLDALLILEEDAIVIDKTFSSFISQLYLGAEGYLVHLHCQAAKWNTKSATRMRQIKSMPTGTFAYLISKSAASKLLGGTDLGGRAFWQADWPPKTDSLRMLLPQRLFFGHDFSQRSSVEKPRGKRGFARFGLTVKFLMVTKNNRGNIWNLSKSLAKRDLYRLFGISPN